MIPAPLRSDRIERRLGGGPLAGVLDKVVAGVRLDRADGRLLYATGDLAGVGYLADLVRAARHGDRVTFIRNVHVNPTNVCVYTCDFCAFARRKGADGGYDLGLDRVADRLAAFVGTDLAEVHMVGGVHPDWPVERYLELVRVVRRTLPGVGIKAWTAVEIDWMHRLSRRPVESLLEDLVEAGLTALPGGGAEIFAPAVRRRICKGKVDGAGWQAIHRAAHRLGIRTNCTMLYGHIETADDRVDHLLALRSVQDDAPPGGGFQAYVPLAFHPAGTALADRPGPTDRSNLREVAVARLLLDNIDHITGYWVMIGSPMAQVSLACGADDLSGTIVRERITHAAGGTSERGLTPDAMVALIEEAGRVPVERDTLYRPRTACQAAGA